MLPALAALAAIVLFVRLGFWQLQRADEAAALQSTMTQRGQAAPTVLDAAALAAQDVAALHWRPVVAQGSWDNARQILLDNRISHGAAGYFVYTPLRIAGCDCVLLVNRGWIAAGEPREIVPPIGSASARMPIRAMAAPAPPVGFGVRGGIESVAPGVLRVQRIDTTELSQQLGMRVLPLTLLLAADEPGGYRREWRLPNLQPDRHVAYAIQWFVFATIVAGLAIVLNLRRR